MSNKQVLIIDNRVKTRGAISRLFSELGCETMTTRDAATGLAAAQHGQFDLVVLGGDLHSSSGSGILQSLKEHNPDLMVVTVDGDGVAPSPPGEGVAGFALVQEVLEPGKSPQSPYPVHCSLRDVEKVHIERVLEHKRWNQSAAAQALGIDRKTLRNKMREFRLDRAE